MLTKAAETLFTDARDRKRHYALDLNYRKLRAEAGYSGRPIAVDQPAR
jgi:hypothetical protein